MHVECLLIQHCGMASCKHGRVDVQVFVCGLPDTESSRMVALQILTDAEEAWAASCVGWISDRAPFRRPKANSAN